MDFSHFVRELQSNSAIDRASLEAYGSLIGSVNKQLLTYARERLDPNDEPADFNRLLLEKRT